MISCNSSLKAFTLLVSRKLIYALVIKQSICLTKDLKKIMKNFHIHHSAFVNFLSFVLEQLLGFLLQTRHYKLKAHNIHIPSNYLHLILSAHHLWSCMPKALFSSSLYLSYYTEWVRHNDVRGKMMIKHEKKRRRTHTVGSDMKVYED